MSDQSAILCSLVSIQEADGHYVYEREERLALRSSGQPIQVRYQGVVYYLGDRVFLIDYESLETSEINQTILVPGFKSQHTRLNGLKLGVTACDRRAPVCSRVVWDSLGPDISQGDAFRRIREYQFDDQELDADLRARLSQAQVIDGVFRMY